MISEGAPNILAYLALLMWPVLAMVFFAWTRPPIACAMVLVGGVMFLPAVVAFDAPLIPPLDKDLIPSAAALIGCLVSAPQALKNSRPFRGYEWFCVLLVFGAFMTVRTNGDPLHYGPTVLQGESFYDFFADSVKLILRWWIPFYLGRVLFKTPEDLKQLLVLLALAGLLYSLFIWAEIRLSPQLNRWIYGYHQSDFVQTIRFGGYRPKVFMRHGLNVALFMLITLMAACCLAKIKVRIYKWSAKTVAIYLTVVLLVCKSSGAVVYGLVVLPLILFASPKAQLRFAQVMAVIMIAYPLLRMKGWVPVDDIVAFFHQTLGEERALSLWFRFETEQQVLMHALDRVWFGWGGYARPFLHDPVTGETISIIDGFWVLTFGERGLVGFVAIFGLMLLPVYRMRRFHARFSDPGTRAVLGCLALICVIYVLDLIPNSSIDPYLTFIIGVVASLGRMQPNVAPAVAPQRASAWNAPATARVG